MVGPSPRTSVWGFARDAQSASRRAWHPVVKTTGKVVDTADVSVRFAWDFRRTLADMWANNHYGTMADLLRQHGIGIYGGADRR